MGRINALAMTLVLALSLALAGALALSQPAQAGGEDAGRKNVTSKRMTLEQTVGGEVFQKAGLAKLSAEEQFVLADWIRSYTIEMTKYVEEQCGRQPAPVPPPKKP